MKHASSLIGLLSAVELVKLFKQPWLYEGMQKTLLLAFAHWLLNTNPRARPELSQLQAIHGPRMQKAATQQVPVPNQHGVDLCVHYQILLSQIKTLMNGLPTSCPLIRQMDWSATWHDPIWTDKSCEEEGSNTMGSQWPMRSCWNPFAFHLR